MEVLDRIVRAMLSFFPRFISPLWRSCVNAVIKSREEWSQMSPLMCVVRRGESSDAWWWDNVCVTSSFCYRFTPDTGGRVWLGCSDEAAPDRCGRHNHCAPYFDFTRRLRGTVERGSCDENKVELAAPKT